MTEMIPDEIPSHADAWTRTIFEAFKHSATARFEDWVVFPSKWVPQRADPSSQRVIDFVLLIEDLRVVICLFSRSSVNLSEAEEITKDLRIQFKDPYFLNDSPLTLTYAVVSQDKGKDSAKIIGDSRYEYTGDLNSLEETLEDYAIHQEGVFDSILDMEAKRLLHDLKSKLDPNNMPTATILEDHDQKFLELTADQFENLIHVELNPRCVIDGAAGTGKTVLAKELAKQLCQNNHTVGLLCSNRYLSHHLESWAETLPNDIHNRILVGTPTTLPIKIFESNGNSILADQYKDQLDNSPELEATLRAGYLDNGWEDFLREIVTDLEPIIDNGVFDHLIVDEAQNLCDTVFLNLMDALLKRGLAAGRWTMFGDFSNQTIVTLDRDPNVRQELHDFGLHWCNAELKTNCRNTHQITEAVTELIHIRSFPRSGVHGPRVEIKLFDSLYQLNEMLVNQIYSWKKRGFKAKNITLLSSGTDNVFEDITQEYGGTYSEWELQHLSPDNSSQDNILRYSDIYDFQGLESNLVILVMPEAADTVRLAGDIVLRRVQHLERILYTGMSRAHTILVILAHKESYEDILKDSWREYPW
jgi:hypothetical protein